jgi:hypothetical protein
MLLLHQIFDVVRTPSWIIIDRKLVDLPVPLAEAKLREPAVHSFPVKILYCKIALRPS